MFANIGFINSGKLLFGTKSDAVFSLRSVFPWQKLKNDYQDTNATHPFVA
jgi:hypothetical protein